MTQFFITLINTLDKRFLQATFDINSTFKEKKVLILAFVIATMGSSIFLQQQILCRIYIAC